MHPHTAEVARNVRAAGTVQEKLDALYHQYEGEDCWVIACGPSASLIDSDECREFLADKLVIVAKDAYALVPGLADFRLVNGLRCSNFHYGDLPPIVVAVSDNRTAEWDDQWDLSLHLSDDPSCRHGGLQTRSVAGSKEWSRWELSKSPDRPPGPGIMEEIGFYLPVHLGVSRIFTLGYDLEEGRRTFFYDPHFVDAPSHDPEIIAAGTPSKLVWLRSHGIAWYRIASTLVSQIPAPTIPLSEACTRQSSSA